MHLLNERIKFHCGVKAAGFAIKKRNIYILDNTLHVHKGIKEHNLQLDKMDILKSYHNR